MRDLRQVDAHASVYLQTRSLPPPLRRLAELLTYTGDYRLWTLGPALVWLVGSESWKAWAAVYFWGMIGVLGVVAIMKPLVRRQRPGGVDGDRQPLADSHSFPSGHAARVTLVAMLSWQFAPSWMGPLLLVWVASAALSRVVLGVHYVFDVLAGSIVGLIIGYALIRLL